MSKKHQDQQVKIFDTTLRDGEQSPGNTMNIQEKLRVARQLEILGVDIIEAGFPIASQGDFEAVQQIARVIKDSQIAGLARANDADIDRAWEAVQGCGICPAFIPLSQHRTYICSISCAKPAKRC